MTDHEFLRNLDILKTRIAALPDIVDAKLIQQTAARLEEIHFTPTLMLPVERFLYLAKADVLAEIDRIAALTEADLRAQGIALLQDANEIKLEQIGLLVYHFELLTELRQDTPEAWDKIDELYAED